MDGHHQKQRRAQFWLLPRRLHQRPSERQKNASHAINCHPRNNAAMSFFEIASAYALFYPSTMATVWVIGGLYYYLTRERQSRAKAQWVHRSNHPPKASVMTFRDEQQSMGEWV